MFNKNHFNQLTSNIEKEDYLNLTIIGPARKEARSQLNSMTSKEQQESMKAYDVHYLGALEAKMISAIVKMKFDIYNIEWC